MTDKKIRPFGKKDELGYVFGDMAGSFVNLFIDAYFLTFCTYAVSYTHLPLHLRSNQALRTFLPEEVQ